MSAPLAAACLCVSGFLFVASVLWRHPGFPLDDSWIAVVMARNLARYHVLGFVPGVRGPGATSLLWAVLFAAKFIFLKSVSPSAFSAALCAVEIGAIGALLKLIAMRDGLPPAESWILALAPLLSGNFLWLGGLGMEHVLFVMLSLAALSAWFTGPGQRAAWSLAAASVSLGLLVLTRPEGILLIAILFLFRKRANRSWKECSFLVLATVIAGGITTWSNWTASHSLLPMTMKGRQWLYFGPSIGTLDRASFLQQIILRTLYNWTFRAPGIWKIPHSETVLIAAGGCAVLGAFALMAKYYLEKRSRTSALLLWMLALFCTYFVIMPSFAHGGRYQPFVILLTPALLAIGALRLAQSSWSRMCAAHPNHRINAAGNRIVLASLALLLALATGASLVLWRSILRDGIDGIEGEHAVLGQWLSQNIPAAELAAHRVGVFDFGRIGFELNGALLDLGGLTDPDYMPYLIKGDVGPYLVQHQTHYLVLPAWRDEARVGGEVLPRILPQPQSHFRLEELKTVCGPYPAAERSLAETNSVLPCQTAYILHYPGDNLPATIPR
jgi:hypothetical protein